MSNGLPQKHGRILFVLDGALVKRDAVCHARPTTAAVESNRACPDPAGTDYADDRLDDLPGRALALRQRQGHSLEQLFLGGEVERAKLVANGPADLVGCSAIAIEMHGDHHRETWRMCAPRCRPKVGHRCPGLGG